MQENNFNYYSKVNIIKNDAATLISITASLSIGDIVPNNHNLALPVGVGGAVSFTLLSLND